MARAGSVPFRLFLPFCLFLSLLIFSGGLPSQTAVAQTASETNVIEGYVTAVHPPDGFDVDGKRVTTTPNTCYGLKTGTPVRSDSPWRASIEIGAYVYVSGAINWSAATATATTVLIRPDRDETLSGLGAIERVADAGAQPIFEADGYRIRITPETGVGLPPGVKSLGDVGANIWVQYVGRRDKDGVLVASQAVFIPAKPAKVKAIKGLDEYDMHFVPPRAAGAASGGTQPPNGATGQEPVLTGNGSVKLYFRTHKIPADQELQARVQRVGARLVPAYQKDLPADDPSKIDFRFYAVDADKLHTEVCSLDGLVLVPMQMVERLKTDDELAAVLADGIAFNLQRQAARIIADNRETLASEAAGDVAGAFIPGVGLAVILGDSVASSKAEKQLEEQRGRVALALMADAGYDPWAAPEAWRLLAPKKLPTVMDSLKYPSRSGYQFSILRLQYKKAGAAMGEPQANAGSQAQ
jgi:hypothetical protein